MQMSLSLIPALPLFLLLLLSVPALRPVVRVALPLAPLPALLAATAAVPPGPQTLDWLLLGTEFAVTETAQVFLFFTALLWMVAGWQAVQLTRDDPHRDRFAACFLAAMTGNLGLLIAQDMASFYSFFAAMSLSSWGLVLHGGGNAQRLAGKIYIGFAVLGELALFAGLAIGAFATSDMALSAMSNPAVPMAAIILASVGFLIKVGTVPVHVWLPLAHSAAPAPASAVLSGAMLKAGLFGLITILPLGTTALPEYGVALAVLSVLGLLVAPLLGLLQGDPKAVLAYSSIGQTSLMTLCLAVALVVPEAWAALLPAVLLLVVHHGFAKAAMFLGVPSVWATSGRVSRFLVLAAMVLPAVALAGLPWTSGFVAKTAIDTGLAGAAMGLGDWAQVIAPALLLGTLGTTLLMIRALVLLARAPSKDVSPSVAAPFAASFGLAGVGLWMMPGAEISMKAPTLADYAPFAIAGALALIVGLGFHFARLRMNPLAPGQALGLLGRAQGEGPTLSLPWPSRSPRPLAPPQRSAAISRPEYGGLAILGAVAVMAILMVLVAGL
ncbi:MAG: proton-conducting transporter membrane subunit [Pseudomonadota bacterium]